MPGKYVREDDGHHVDQVGLGAPELDLRQDRRLQQERGQHEIGKHTSELQSP